MKVLHVLGSLERGGTETWLLALFREMQADDRIRHEVVIQRPATRDGYEDDIRSLGIPIHLIPRNALWPLRLFRCFRSLSHDDIVHSHRDAFSAFVLFIAWLARVPRRIAQNHSAHSPAETPFQRSYRYVCRTILMMVATDRVAVSEGAQASLFGRSPTASSVIYCGVDIEQYQFDSANRERIRQELATLDDVPVILHVGGFRPVKNHVFLIEIFRAFKAGYEPRAKLWLVGDGPLRKEIEVHVAASGLVGAVRFLGTRSDVPAVLSAADVFLFPSHFEGLGLAVVEAQAAGLSVVISDVIPAEATVVDGLVTRKGFSDSAESWAEAVDQAYRAHCGRNVDPGQLQRFDIRSNARRIRRVYGLTD